MIVVLCSLHGFAFADMEDRTTMSLVCQPETIKSTSGENVDASESLPTVLEISYFDFPNDGTGKMAIITQTGDFRMEYTGRISASEITGSNELSGRMSILEVGLWSINVNRYTGQYTQEMENKHNNKIASIFGKCKSAENVE